MPTKAREEYLRQRGARVVVIDRGAPEPDWAAWAECQGPEARRLPAEVMEDDPERGIAVGLAAGAAVWLLIWGVRWLFGRWL